MKHSVFLFLLVMSAHVCAQNDYPRFVRSACARPFDTCSISLDCGPEGCPQNLTQGQTWDGKCNSDLQCIDLELT